MKSSPRVLLSIAAWLLVPAAIVPYAFFAQNFRVLFWVVQNLYTPFFVLMGLILVFSALASLFLFQALRQGLYFFIIGACLALGNGIYLAMSERRHSLLIILFCLATALVLLAEWMRQTLQRPYYFSRRVWWESYPKAIPSMKVRILGANGDRRHKVRLSNLGVEGCFVFFEENPAGFEPREIEIEGAGFHLSCPVQVAIKSSDGLGMGLLFIETAASGDWEKLLRDYLLELRRAGYVSS